MNGNRLQKLLEFYEKDPSDPFLKYALATEYLNLNEAETALIYFEDLVRNHPEYTGTYYHLGKLYESLGRKDEALQTWQKGMEITRKAGDAHAYAELQSVYLSASGTDYEDD